MNNFEIMLNMLNLQAEALEGQETNIVTDYIIKVENPVQKIFKDNFRIK